MFNKSFLALRDYFDGVIVRHGYRTLVGLLVVSLGTWKPREGLALHVSQLLAFFICIWTDQSSLYLAFRAPALLLSVLS